MEYTGTIRARLSAVNGHGRSLDCLSPAVRKNEYHMSFNTILLHMCTSVECTSVQLLAARMRGDFAPVSQH